MKVYDSLKKIGYDRLFFNVFGYIIMFLLALICFLPFMTIISASFTNEGVIIREGYTIYPKEFSLQAYEMLFRIPETIIRAYTTTIIVTTIGTVIGLFLMTMTAYVIQSKDFVWRNYFAFFFFFTTLFNGGLVPWYILIVRYLNLKNTYLALILPLLFNVFYIIILKAFIKGIPESISESGKIDGAGEFRVFVQLILPLSKSALASIGLFLALQYWNDWYNAMLFIEDKNLFNLQYYLYRVISSSEVLKFLGRTTGTIGSELPTESFKMATAVITIGPIIFLYPIIQKNFVKGITIGAVKG